ncbi:unnamed protein product [Lepeophtheirus salmonis]|uniref:(salmon louse) hypothetical protein n=1 Tax=Lepeophtheirus salmonis TaxID=72036 RepID=A0A7R8CW15_LEPSM|nr:unnamed protein product [Lepeophtheirus salmonis]CAF2949536.1 unnamed protein product [Lepeophtheirus salmonis]
MVDIPEALVPQFPVVHLNWISSRAWHTLNYNFISEYLADDLVYRLKGISAPQFDQSCSLIILASLSLQMIQSLCSKFSCQVWNIQENVKPSSLYKRMKFRDFWCEIFLIDDADLIPYIDCYDPKICSIVLMQDIHGLLDMDAVLKTSQNRLLTPVILFSPTSNGDVQLSIWCPHCGTVCAVMFSILGLFEWGVLPPEEEHPMVHWGMEWYKGKYKIVQTGLFPMLLNGEATAKLIIIGRELQKNMVYNDTIDFISYASLRSVINETSGNVADELEVYMGPFDVKEFVTIVCPRTFFSYFIVGGILSLVSCIYKSWRIHPEIKPAEKPLKWISRFEVSYGIPFGEGVPNKWIGPYSAFSIILTFWQLMAMVLILSYTCNLRSYLIVNPYERPIDSLEELKVSNYQFVVGLYEQIYAFADPYLRESMHYFLERDRLIIKDSQIFPSRCSETRSMFCSAFNIKLLHELQKCKKGRHPSIPCGPKNVARVMDSGMAMRFYKDNVPPLYKVKEESKIEAQSLDEVIILFYFFSRNFCCVRSLINF